MGGAYCCYNALPIEKKNELKMLNNNENNDEDNESNKNDDIYYNILINEFQDIKDGKIIERKNFTINNNDNIIYYGDMNLDKNLRHGRKMIKYVERVSFIYQMEIYMMENG